MVIADRLRSLREEKKLSQGDIEKRTGLLRCYISRVENGHTVPAIETLEKMARANGQGCTLPEQAPAFVGEDGRRRPQAAAAYDAENGHSLTLFPVVSFSHHHDVLGKRLVLDSTDRENHLLSRFENVTIHNVGQNEGNPGTVRAINNSKPLRVNFLHDSCHLSVLPCTSGGQFYRGAVGELSHESGVLETGRR